MASPLGVAACALRATTRLMSPLCVAAHAGIPHELRAYTQCPPAVHLDDYRREHTHTHTHTSGWARWAHTPAWSQLVDPGPWVVGAEDTEGERGARDRRVARRASSGGRGCNGAHGSIVAPAVGSEPFACGTSSVTSVRGFARRPFARATPRSVRPGCRRCTTVCFTRCSCPVPSLTRL